MIASRDLFLDSMLDFRGHRTTTWAHVIFRILYRCPDIKLVFSPWGTSTTSLQSSTRPLFSQWLSCQDSYNCLLVSWLRLVSTQHQLIAVQALLQTQLLALLRQFRAVPSVTSIWHTSHISTSTVAVFHSPLLTLPETPSKMSSIQERSKNLTSLVLA